MRLIDSDGKQLGILKIAEAKYIAREKKLDLVEVAPMAKPPVCRIMDYGKYRYEQTKRERQAKKKQHVVKVKEVKISPRIGNHDYGIKIKHLIEFLKKGCKVKVTLMFRGREMAHKELGRNVLERIVEDTKEYGAVEMRPREMGRFVTMVMGSKSTKSS